MDGLMFALLITFTICFIIGFGGCYFKTQNQSILEETERIIRRTNDLSMTYINDYYESNKLRMDEIEKTLLTEIACLATKNNNDIKEIKDKITTGKKSKRISQLIDENNKLKEENKKLKEENNKFKKEKNNKILNNNASSYRYIPVYNPYTGVTSLCGYDVIKVNNYNW
jgi:seryl-tRNA synthetase